MPSDPPAKKPAPEEAAKKPAAGGNNANNKKKDEADAESSLSPEDRKLKEALEAAVARLIAAQDAGVSDADFFAQQRSALDELRKEVKNATSSMTAIPKPLKFLRASYGPLKACYNDPVRMRVGGANPNKPLLADVLSMLAMTQGSENREVLAFRLLGSQEPLAEWGTEYIRALAGEVGLEHQKMVEEDLSPDELVTLIDSIIEYDFAHNAEFEALDLLIEVGQVSKAVPFITADTALRCGKYLLACAAYLDVEEQEALYRSAVDMLLAHGHHAYAVIAALKLPAMTPLSDADAASDAAEAGEVDVTAPYAARDLTVLRCFAAVAEDEAAQRQLGYILGSQRVYLPAVEARYAAAAEPMGNVALSQQFLELAKDLDVLEPKAPADVYKEHLEDRGVAMRRAHGTPAYDSAMQNLSATMVNAFVNLGFGKDTLLLGADGAASNSEWLFRHKDAGLTTAAASVGMLSLWNVEEGFSTTDKYSFAKTQPFVTAGAHLASGLLSTGVTSDMNASLALLSEQLESESEDTRVAALLGLGVAYAGSCNEEVMELVVPLVADAANSIALVSMAIFALGLVFTGSANAELFGTAVEALADRDNGGANAAAAGGDLALPVARLACIGMGLLYLNTQRCEMALEVAAAVQHPIKAYLLSVVETFASAGTGSVLQLQKLLGLCAEKPTGSVDGDDEEEEEEEEAEAGAKGKDGKPVAATAAASAGVAGAAAAGSAAGAAGAAGEEKKDNKDDKDKAKLTAAQLTLKNLPRGSSVLGLAAVAMGEDLASQMALRSLDHVYQCGDVHVRRAVPLALALVSVSNPQLPVMDTLSKLSHDQDEFVSMNAVLGLGVLGAGTNNSRIAAMLRNLAAFYSREPHHLFVVRIAQGLLHLGKGLCTLSPRSHEQQLLNRPALGALLALLHLSLDLPESLIKARHYLFFVLAAAVRPRFLMAVDEAGAQVPVQVRVGQAVDGVGQPGNPRTITGFQTHTTPVLLATGERAELATDDYIALTEVLEGVVVVKPNPKAVGKEI